VDTYFTKVNSLFFGALRATGEERDVEVKKITDAIEKEIEPLLKDAKPFFGGAERLTLAEVCFSSSPIGHINRYIGSNWILHPSSSVLP